MGHFDETFWWDILMRHFDGLWITLMTCNDLWWFLMTFDMVMMSMGWPYDSFDCLLVWITLAASGNYLIRSSFWWSLRYIHDIQEIKIMITKSHMLVVLIPLRRASPNSCPPTHHDKPVVLFQIWKEAIICISHFLGEQLYLRDAIREWQGRVSKAYNSTGLLVSWVIGLNVSVSICGPPPQKKKLFNSVERRLLVSDNSPQI